MMMMTINRFLLLIIIIQLIIYHTIWEYNNNDKAVFAFTAVVDAWLPTISSSSKQRMGMMMLHTQHNRRIQQFILFSTPPNSDNESNNNNEEWSDFDDLGYIIGDSSSNNSGGSMKDGLVENETTKIGKTNQPYIPLKDDIVDTDDVTTIDFAMLLQQKQEQPTNNKNNDNNNISYMDSTAIQTRQFELGKDIVLSNYVGTMGFQEVTDWEYYYNEDEDDDNNDSNSNVLNKKVPSRRQVVQPNPFDSSKPRRTRTSSGSIVRIFRGEFVGTLGGILSSQGLDRRILIKEFSDTDLALSLVRSELQSIGRLQSNLMFSSIQKEDAKVQGIEWIRTASARRTTLDLRKDSANVVSLIKSLATAPYVGILGEVNLSVLDDDMEPNAFYRAMGVPPPQSGSVWVVYEYAGLSTVQAYSVPVELRLAKLPLKRGLFGNIIGPPKPPAWKDRANYIVKGIMKSTINAIATIHENGMIHGSIGRASIILSSKEMDKTNAVSPLNTMVSTLRVKLSDFSFAKLFEESTNNEEFCIRAKAFGLNFQKGDNNILTTNFAIAEDMHAVGFVFLGLLLTTLAELPQPVLSTYQMPATDEDTLQRLLGDIFDKDMTQFRDFVLEEDVWSKLVELLDENDRSGWRVLETLLLAREKAAKNKDTDQLFTIRGLLSTPFFQ